MRLVTRVAPGLVVSTVTDDSGATAVVFATDLAQPSGCNVLRTARGAASEVRDLHRTACALADLWLVGAAKPKDW